MTYSKDIRKVNTYFPPDLADEIKAEAERLDRSPSWLLIRAWRIAQDRVHRLCAPLPGEEGGLPPILTNVQVEPLSSGSCAQERPYSSSESPLEYRAAGPEEGPKRE